MGSWVVMRFPGELELHDGIGRPESVGDFSSLVRRFAPLAQQQPDQPERQQAAQFGAALHGGHLVRVQGVGTRLMDMFRTSHGENAIRESPEYNAKQ
jgi:hypothetical protein